MITKETVGNLATGTAIGSGLTGSWVNDHSQMLLLGISAFSAIVALVFYVLNFLEKKKQTAIMAEGNNRS